MKESQAPPIPAAHTRPPPVPCEPCAMPKVTAMRKPPASPAHCLSPPGDGFPKKKGLTRLRKSFDTNW